MSKEKYDFDKLPDWLQELWNEKPNIARRAEKYIAELSEQQATAKTDNPPTSEELSIGAINKRSFTLKEAQEIYFAGLLTNKKSWDEKENTEEYDNEFIEMIKRSYF